ncbi:MAG TPA: ATP-binding protein [Flavisolibacter sp.]|nr:ATP-binding protein [Flavisolibacter sp.]
MQALNEIKTWLLQQPIKANRMLRQNQPQGQRVLFSGQDSKAKLAAAEQLAKESGKELYRIDLSQVVSKYIGETEKNLKAVFDKAEASGSILFFDEADALFGKRTTVKDSHDRYANIEVSYLLQRMEAFRGLVILSVTKKEKLELPLLQTLRLVEFRP